MPKWQNWSGKLSAEPQQLVFARSVADVQALLEQASKHNQRVRTAGATHSHAPLVASDDIILDIAGLAGLISCDPDRKTASMWAGSRIFTLGRALHDAGLALHNQGDIDQQTIAGATATGTHGTGVTLSNFSARVCGFELVTSSGELLRADREQNSELWQAARLHLGAFGVMTAMTLDVRESYRLRERSWQAPLAPTLESFDQHAGEHRHCEFFWYPQQDQATVKVTDETREAPEYPLAEEGKRCAWNYEVLPNHRPHKHTEMEYSVPAEQGIDCMRAIARLLHERFPEVQWPVEYRTLAADEVWLSTARNRATVTISVHQDVRLDDAAYFRACEEVFLEHDGKPHWGKVNYLNAGQMAARHEDWEAWWRVRDRLDPTSTFLNPYLERIRPS